MEPGKCLDCGCDLADDEEDYCEDCLYKEEDDEDFSEDND